MRSRTVMSFVLTVAISLSACGGVDPDESEDPALTPSVEASAGGQRWLAAVQVAPRADDLDVTTERLIEVFGTSLVVSPADCFDGLPAGVDDGYVVGAVGWSRDEVERLVADAGEKVLFTASVTIACTD